MKVVATNIEVEGGVFGTIQSTEFNWYSDRNLCLTKSEKELKLEIFCLLLVKRLEQILKRFSTLI